jgi:SET domain-containing protein
MLVVKTKLKEITGKGIGLIADQEVKKGQSIWVYNPVIDIKVNKKDIPEKAEEFFKIYSVDIGEDCVYLNLDNARFINHSENPNTKSLGPFKDNIAIRDIPIGEEITINYGEIDINGVDF